VFEVAIQPGQLDNFRAVVKEMVESTQANEPGTMNYEYFISDDGTYCNIYERYADSAAIMKHLGAIREKFSDRFFPTFETKRLTVYGNPDDEVRRTFSAMGAVFLRPSFGFAR
jgi:quinol monooxygenase YgiN